MYKTVVNSYEVIIKKFFYIGNIPFCTVYVPELDLTDGVPQSLIDIIDI